jgi:hypothetical protein
MCEMPSETTPPKRLCAFCGSEGSLTREHLWPASLHRRPVAANQNTGNLFWLRRIDREVQGEPTLRDVCDLCNNGVLSDLDAYVCRLFDRYFVRILQRYERVNFEYDYHLLKRWLLKMSYNSARIHNSIDLFAYPGKLPPDRLGGADLVDAPSTWEPQDNRCGHMYFNVAGVGQKVLRAVHLRSYSFFLAFFEPGGKSATLKHFTETFLSIVPRPRSSCLLAHGWSYSATAWMRGIQLTVPVKTGSFGRRAS